MPSTYSPSLRIELIGAGEQSGTWGTTTNTNLGTLLEQSIAGVQAITMFDADYTLTNYNGVSDEARKAVLVVGGTNSAVRNIIAPLVTKTYTIKNNTVGGFAILIKAATGASVSIPNGGTSTVYCDGTDFQLALTQTIVAAGAAISVATVGVTTTVTNTGVASFNTRTGAVTQTSADVTTALGYTPPTPTGTGASGTWGINVTGNAATSTNATTAASCSGNAATATNPQSGGSFITSSNIGSQSVSFASSATNATNATNATIASNLNGTWNQMPAGTTTNFFQAAAPTGWVQRTDLNDFMLYIVSGTGGGSGGVQSPLTMNVVPYHTHGFSTSLESAAHSHYVNDPGHSHTYSMKFITGGTTAGGDPNNLGTRDWTTSTAATGIYLNNQNANHYHTGGTDGGSSQTNWSPRYLSNIMCYKA